MKITFIKNRDFKNEFDLTDVTINVEADDIRDVIEAFREFLLACSYPSVLVDRILGEWGEGRSEESCEGE